MVLPQKDWDEGFWRFQMEGGRVVFGLLEFRLSRLDWEEASLFPVQVMLW